MPVAARGMHVGKQQMSVEHTTALRSLPSSPSPGPGAPSGGGADIKTVSLPTRKEVLPRPARVVLEPAPPLVSSPDH